MNRICQNCGAKFPKREDRLGEHQRFCAPRLESIYPDDPHSPARRVDCRREFHNRQVKRGQIMVPLVLAWRGGRGRTAEAKYAFEQMAALADRFNAEDHAAGRPPMFHYVRGKMAAKWSAADVVLG